MTKIISSTLKFIFLIILFINLTGFHPTEISLNLDKKKSTLKVEGTSNLHDWETSLTSFEGYLTIQKGSDNVIQTFSDVSLKFYSKSFKSGKSMMDSNTLDAVKADKFPVITFKSSDIKEIKKNGDKRMLLSNGSLTIAGVTEQTEVMGIETAMADGTLIIEGKKEITLSDFDIKPPEALLGTLKTGNIITVTYNLYFK